MELQNKLKKAALGTALDYIAKDPERNIHKLMSWVDTVSYTHLDVYKRQIVMLPWPSPRS